MGIKHCLKQVLGEQRLSDAKGIVLHHLIKGKMLFKRIPSLQFNKEKLQIKAVLTDKNYHVFRGYYDLRYLHEDGQRFLCHRLPINAKNNKATKCQVGYYDLADKQYHLIAESSAWCWQQGSRLRWHPTQNDRIVYNDVNGESYCTRIVNVQNGKLERTIVWPLYDISSDFKWGISLNFTRLQHFRPGYGYNYFDYLEAKESHIENDGLFLVDIDKNSAEHIVNLKVLADAVDPVGKYDHYLNHVSIAPNNARMIFFHIYKGKVKNWKTVLYVYEFATKKLTALEKEDRVSHYCWINDHQLMVTCHRDDGTEYYCKYDTNNFTKKIVSIKGLDVDGHPSPLESKGVFITDTYPRSNSMQSLEIFSEQERNLQVIAMLYHDYRMRGEKRCDLHPTIEAQGNSISMDTTYSGKRRSVIIFNLMEV